MSCDFSEERGEKISTQPKQRQPNTSFPYNVIYVCREPKK